MQEYLKTDVRAQLANINTKVAGIGKLLECVADSSDDPGDGSIMTLPDVHFMRLMAAEDAFKLASQHLVADVAGDRAGQAIREYQNSFRGIREIYGRGCGPDRDRRTAAAVVAYLRRVAGAARIHLAEYRSCVGPINGPSLEDQIDALQRGAAALKAASEHVGSSPTPRIPKTLPGEEIAQRARGLLGYAYSGLCIGFFEFVRKRATDNKYGPVIALSELSGVSIHVSIKASRLADRAEPEHRCFVDHLQGTADDIEAFRNGIEDEIVRGSPTKDDLDRIATEMKPHILRASHNILEVEKLARRFGYDVRFREPA